MVCQVKSYAGDAYPSWEKETRVGAGAGEVQPPGGGIDVDSRDSEETNEGSGWGVVEEPEMWSVFRCLRHSWCSIVAMSLVVLSKLSAAPIRSATSKFFTVIIPPFTPFMTTSDRKNGIFLPPRH
ncbi:hypothetical protein MPH_11051 [Macrophomina phaseolina MS6]|uniref:Uncharacterized protein n=1 Tax=Macrophomina phaseolina (strain MS6) TaxID=1126212 RepID=K2RAP4_MACPH|nr:hypothetical protein MPH_11051 [Macrophomina phaseolina MS6]